jgi:hypothetical protein
LVILEDLVLGNRYHPLCFQISENEWYAVKEVAKRILNHSGGLSSHAYQIVKESLDSYKIGGPINSSIAHTLFEQFSALAVYMQEKDLDQIYVSTGKWYHSVVTPDGSVIRERIQDKNFTDDLDTMFPKGFLFTHLPVSQGIEFSSDLDLSYDTIRQLSLFLETCSGFKVY